MIIQRLIDDDIPFGVISCNGFGVGNKDIFLVMPSIYADRYSLRTEDVYNDCSTVTLGDREIDYFVGLINTEFKVYKKGKFGCIYERKTNSLIEYLEKIEQLISTKTGDNEGEDT